MTKEHSSCRHIPDKSLTPAPSRISVSTFHGTIEISVVAPHAISTMNLMLLADDAEWLGSQLQQAARVATSNTESEGTEQ